MVNFLYLIAIAAYVYSGFSALEWWAVLPFGAVFAVLFYLSKPRAFSIGWREGGVMYLIRFLIMNSILAAIPFGIGRVLAMMLK